MSLNLRIKRICTPEEQIEDIQQEKDDLFDNKEIRRLIFLLAMMRNQ